MNGNGKIVFVELVNINKFIYLYVKSMKLSTWKIEQIQERDKKKYRMLCVCMGCVSRISSNYLPEKYKFQVV